MSDVTTERLERYVLDGGNDDLRRLLTIAQVTEPAARAACERIGVTDGWSAIDCGCGPLGALSVLARVVGPNGSVVGVDFNEASIHTAGAAIAALGLRNVELVLGDVDADVIGRTAGRRFDLAFTRCFLMHQPDPVHTLGRIAAMLRPGGWIVVQEPLRFPPPRSSPRCEALSAYWELLHDAIESTGVPHNSVDRLPAFAQAAGLEVAAQNGFFIPAAAPLAFDLHAGTLAAAKSRAIGSGVASKTRIDELIGELRAAARAGYDWATTPFYCDLTLHKPVAANNDADPPT
jgi:SAM-dependent methyltransferase